MSREPKKAEQEPKRKAPITGRKYEEDLDLEEDEDVDMDNLDEDEFDEDVEMEAGDGVETGVEGDAPAGLDGEQAKRLSKAEKAALHAQQPHRTTLLPSHPLLKDTLLPLWEDARRADLSKEERSKKIKQLYEAVKGRVREVGRGHKGGRVLQTIVKYGGKEERNGIAVELDGLYKQMLESKYSKFLMAKLIRHCPSVRLSMISQLSPHIPTLIAHSHAITPLADFYELHASSKERRLMVRAFYPKEVLLFDGLGIGGTTPEGKDEIKKNVEKGIEIKGLVKTLEGMGEGAIRTRVLDLLMERISAIFNSTQKEALAQAIFHRLVLEYLQAIYAFLAAEEADKKMHDLLDVCIESLADIVHTKDGSAVAREMLARGVAKDRKNILRVLKPHLEKLCQDAEAQMVLFTAFDVVDDTKMMAKAILTEVAVLAPGLAMHKTGRRVLLYLVTPRSTRHFIPSTIKDLEVTDATAAATSKKNKDTRRKELRAAISPDMIKLVAEQGEELMRDAGASLLVTEIMLEAEGDKTEAIEALVRPIGQTYPNPASVDPEQDPATAPILDISYADRAYKTLLAGGRFNSATSSVESANEDLRRRFGKAFWQALTSEEAGGEQNAVNLALGNAPFVVVELIDNLKTDEKLAPVVKRVLATPEVMSQVEKSWRKGASLLHQKLAAL